MQKTIKSIQAFFENHTRLKKAFIIALVFPYVIFCILLFTPIEVYNPLLTSIYEWIFLGVAVSFPILLFILLKRKKFGLGFALVLVSMLTCVALFLVLLVGSGEEARLSTKDKTYTLVSDLNLNSGTDNYCLYEYENPFLSEKIDCFYSTSWKQTPYLLYTNDTLLVFLNGTLRYSHGVSPFGERWLDSALSENSLFHLTYKDGKGKVIYELYKCTINNAACVRQPFYFSTPSLQYAKLYRFSYEPSPNFYIEIGTDFADSEFVYEYRKEPACLVEGCELK